MLLTYDKQHIVYSVLVTVLINFYRALPGNRSEEEEGI